MRRRTRSRSPVRSETASLTVPLGHFADGCDDVGIGGAPADVAAHPFGDFGIGQGRRGRDIRRRVARPACLVFGEERDGRANLAGRAVPALESIMAHESGLHGMQRALLCQTFDGGDLVAVMHHRECQAAIDALSIDDDRAGAALSLVAALLRTGQREMLSQSIEQRGPRIEVQGIVPPVDREPYVLARQRSSLRRRLAHRGWRRERQSCGPGRLEKAAPGRHGSKLEKIVHNTASTCVGEPPDEATLTKCNHTARTLLRVDCCDLLDTAPRERKAPLGRDPRPSLRIGADPAARHTVAPSTSRPPTLAISAIYTKSFINKRNWFRRAKRN